ncbi:MAG: hypothetical protein IPQ07_13220 [Myxococcales bacterium]|nr:hypothetical protein [Myxococcales bacterium]
MAYWWWYGPWYEHQNLRDERVEAFTQELAEGVHAYAYVTRATTPGTFNRPAAEGRGDVHARDVRARSERQGDRRIAPPSTGDEFSRMLEACSVAWRCGRCLPLRSRVPGRIRGRVVMGCAQTPPCRSVTSMEPSRVSRTPVSRSHAALPSSSRAAGTRRFGVTPPETTTTCSSASMAAPRVRLNARAMRAPPSATIRLQSMMVPTTSAARAAPTTNVPAPSVTLTRARAWRRVRLCTLRRSDSIPICVPRRTLVR